MAVTIGRPIAFGVVPVRVIKGLPEGKARLRMRQEEFVSVWVRTRTGIRRFYLEEVDDYWVPTMEAEANADAVRCPSHNPATLPDVRRNRLLRLAEGVERGGRTTVHHHPGGVDPVI